MKYITKIEQLEKLNENEKEILTSVAERFNFRCNEYYMSLIDCDDPDDPIRRAIIPSIDELDDYAEIIEDYPNNLPYRIYGPE